MELDQLRIETFEPHIGTTFTFTAPNGQTFELTLTQVGRIMERVRSTRLKRQPFSIYFEGAKEFLLPQFTYSVSHPALGEDLPIFIVPVAKDDGSVQYEAVFT
jgi:hypothetical protein